jgi:hypothetical protein
MAMVATDAIISGRRRSRRFILEFTNIILKYLTQNARHASNSAGVARNYLVDYRITLSGIRQAEEHSRIGWIDSNGYLIGCSRADDVEPIGGNADAQDVRLCLQFPTGMVRRP